VRNLEQLNMQMAAKEKVFVQSCATAQVCKMTSQLSFAPN